MVKSLQPLTKNHKVNMSLETLCVKTEGEVCVKEEAEECRNEETEALVQQGAGCDTVGLHGLYGGHQIKDELVLGPEEMHRPCVSSALPAATGTPGNSSVGRACSVRPERPLEDTEQRPARLKRGAYLSAPQYMEKLLSDVRTSIAKGPFKCSYCDYKSNEKANIQSHERIHRGEKPFQCSYCDYKCSHKSNLIVHVRIHTREKPFHCSRCNYKCTKKTFFQNHLRRHTEEKLFKCSHCDYKCSQKSDLQSHEKTHTVVNSVSPIVLVPYGTMGTYVNVNLIPVVTTIQYF